jgi:hypothetical protein
MKFLSTALAISIFASACAGAPRAASMHEASISLDVVERLVRSRASGDELRATLGPPAERAAFGADRELWVYSTKTGEATLKRASFVLERSTARVLSGEWLPEDGDSLRRLDQALARFRGDSFVSQAFAWNARREYPDDELLEDRRAGVSLIVRRSDRTVSAISFEPGSP